MICNECGRNDATNQGLCADCYGLFLAEAIILDSPIPDVHHDEHDVEDHPLLQENDYDGPFEDQGHDEDFNEGLYGDDTFFD